MGYVCREAVSGKKKLRIQNIPVRMDVMWTWPPQWSILACVLCFNFRPRDGSQRPVFEFRRAVATIYNCLVERLLRLIVENFADKRRLKQILI